MQIYFQKLSISAPNMLFLLKNLRNSTIFFTFAIEFDIFDFFIEIMQEYFPIVNDAGEVIGKASRQECHSQTTPDLRAAMLHPVVHLHVFSSDGRLYLQQRAMHKDLLPGYWDTAVGGHVQYGETILDALTREVNEEIGISDYDPEHWETYRFDSNRECEMVHVYRTIYDGPFLWNDGEVSDGRFWSIEELQSVIGKGILTPNLELELKRFNII